jgi:hypothetical protein
VEQQNKKAWDAGAGFFITAAGDYFVTGYGM